MFPPPKVLRIFSRYQQGGGEETVARRIHQDLAGCTDAHWFEYSTDEMLGTGALGKGRAAWRALHNADAVRRLRELQRAHGFQAWEIHNAFPGLSPAVYREAFRQGVRVLQWLHNYRFSCVNGTFLNHGRPCQRCIKGNFWPAVRTACWKESRAACAVMGAALVRTRQLGTLARVDAWVALSEAHKRLHVRMGIPAERIAVVPHHLAPVETDPSPPPPNGPALFLGRLSVEKGVSQLLEAWRKVRSPGKTLTVAGTGPEEANLRRQAQALGLRNVVFLGHVPAERQRELWSRARFLVAPSVWEEPFGLVVLEAWAHGRPVLTSDRGAFPELVADAGLTVSPDEPETFARNLDRLFDEEDLAPALAVAGRDRLLARHGRANWLDGVGRVYAGLGLPLGTDTPTPHATPVL